MSKKLILLLVIVLTLVSTLSVSATFSDTNWDEVDPTGQSIVFWHNHTGEREEALQQIVADFNATNEYGITAEAILQGSYGDIFEQMLLVVGTSDAPDLVVAYQNQAATYQLVDGLVDMTGLVNSETWGLSEDEVDDFFAGFYSADVFPNFDNQRLGFPPNRSMEMLYFNSDWLAELAASGAIMFEGPPTTPDQFREAACAAAANPYSGATGDTSTSIGYELSIDASRFASWTFAFGGDVFDYEGGEFSVNSPAAVEAMTFLQGLFADGCARMVTESFGDQTNFGAGTTLFTVGSSSGLPFYESAVSDGANFSWSVGPIPHTTEEPVQNIYGASVSIASDTPEAALAAWIFLKYYTSPDVQSFWAEQSNYFPVRASVADGLTDYFAENETYAAAWDLLQYGVTEPPVPGYDFIRTVIEEYMTEVVSDPMSDVQGLLDEANQESNDILADQF